MKQGIFTGLLIAIVIGGLWGAIALSINAFGRAVDNTAAVKMAEAQGRAIVEQAVAQGELMRAQTDITYAAADAMRADTRAAHGASAAQVALIAVLVCAGVALIALLAWRLRLAEAQLRAVVAARFPEEQAQ